MSRGKYQSKPKWFPLLTVALLALLGVAIISGGTVAYLAKSADSAVTNTFETAPMPAPQVVVKNGAYYADIGTASYAVYVRAAVVPNWKVNGQIIPASLNSFTIEAGAGWKLHSDGFIYYTDPVTTSPETPIYTEIKSTVNSGGSIEVDVAVQVVQALGTADVGEETAVMNAWKVQPESLKTTP